MSVRTENFRSFMKENVWGGVGPGLVNSLRFDASIAHLTGEDAYDKASMITAGTIGHLGWTASEAVGGFTNTVFGRKPLSQKYIAEGKGAFRRARAEWNRLKTPSGAASYGALSREVGAGASSYLKGGAIWTLKTGMKMLGASALFFGAYTAIRHLPEAGKKFPDLHAAKVGGSLKTMRTQSEFLQTMQRHHGLFQINSLLGREAEFYHGR